MRTWAIIIFLWITPAMVLLAALLRANMRKSARRRASEADALGPVTPKKAKGAPAE